MGLTMRDTAQPVAREGHGRKEQGSEEHSENDSGRDSVNYDLCPPSPEAFSDTIAGRAENHFSSTHLLQILQDKGMRMAFGLFLRHHSPTLSMVLDRYLENQKALAAVAYANAIVAGQKPLVGTQDSHVAAVTDAFFLEKSQSTFEILLSEALPAYIAYQLTKEVTEQLPLQISTMEGRRERMPDAEGVNEVFCLTNPNMKSNPILYASREFFRLTQYGREYAIGRNCSFLQGPGTSTECTARLAQAIRRGQAVNETILNYRRDGSPFINLLMMAPLHDDRGNVKVSNELLLVIFHVSSGSHINIVFHWRSNRRIAID